MNQVTDRKKKLGRGLGALLGEVQREEPLEYNDNNDLNKNSSMPRGGGLSNIAVSDIEPLPDQPRTYFDDEALNELAASIAQRGVIQPVIVTAKGTSGKYRLVAGERRWRAAQRARLHTIPAIIRELDQREVLALALIENLQREDLNPLEEARAYQKLADEEGMTQAEIAKLVDKSRSHVANLQRLLVLPDDVLALLANGKISMGHARALIGNEDASGIAARAAGENLSVREVEKLARGVNRPERARKPSSRASEAESNEDITALQSHLEEFLGLPVKIKTDAGTLNTGSVTIRYRTLDQLDLICQRLTGGDI